MIPVEKGSPYYPKEDRPHSLPPQRAASIAGYPNTIPQNNNNSVSLDSVATLSPDEENKRNINEFLGKIDSSIAESKKFVVETSQKNNE